MIFQDGPKRTGNNSFANTANDTAGHENVLHVELFASVQDRLSRSRAGQQKAS